MKSVLIIEPFDAAGIRLLDARSDVTYEVVDSVSSPGFEEKLMTAEAVTLRMTPFGEGLISKAPNLHIVSRHGVGYDTVDVSALSKRGIPLAVVGDVNAIAVAEHTLCLILALARQLPRYDQAVRTGDFAFRTSASSIELDGKTILLIGYGRIGRVVAKRCLAFGMKVLTTDPAVEHTQIEADGCVPISKITEALGDADFVSLHAPLTPDTRGLVSREMFNRMKPTAYLINTARGGEVDELALVEALEQGQIAGAALDVFAPQPPRPDNPLLSRSDVILTPHSAGMTRECARRIAIDCVQNVLDAFDGKLAPEKVINKDVLEKFGP